MALFFECYLGWNKGDFLYYSSKKVQHDSEIRVKKKFVLLSFLAIGTLALSACLFDSDEDGLGNWLSDQGLPDSYKVQTVSVDGLVPSEVNVYRDSTPLIMDGRIVFGNSANMSHEMAFEFLYGSKKDDSLFLKHFKKADTTGAHVALYVLTSFYKDKNIPVELLPIKEKLKVNVSWKLRKGKKKAFLDSLYDVSDSVWQRSLKKWKPDAVVDTTYSINVKKADGRVLFEIPGEFLDSLKTCHKYCHLEMRMAAPETENLYRFYTLSNTKKLASFNFRSIDKGGTLYKVLTYTPYRMANVIVNNDCSDCLVLHGGVKDSIVFEYPTEPIFEALSEFYGDEFPYKNGDDYDVRQAVVLAQLTFARDDSKGENHLGLPIRVMTGSIIDSSDKEVTVQEFYKLNKPDVAKSGHKNMVFYKGDSLTIQVTQGMRDFLNRANYGAKPKFTMFLYYPQLQDDDSTFKAKIIQKDTVKTRIVNGDTVEMKVSKGDTSYVYLSHYDYARYDFSSMMKKPATLKLWLATKRGGDDE